METKFHVTHYGIKPEKDVENQWNCSTYSCNETFESKDERDQHLISVHSAQKLVCPVPRCPVNINMYCTLDVRNHYEHYHLHNHCLWCGKQELYVRGEDSTNLHISRRHKVSVPTYRAIIRRYFDSYWSDLTKDFRRLSPHRPEPPPLMPFPWAIEEDVEVPELVLFVLRMSSTIDNIPYWMLPPRDVIARLNPPVPVYVALELSLPLNLTAMEEEIDAFREYNEILRDIRKYQRR